MAECGSTLCTDDREEFNYEDVPPDVGNSLEVIADELLSLTGYGNFPNNLCSSSSSSSTLNESIISEPSILPNYIDLQDMNIIDNFIPVDHTPPLNPLDLTNEGTYISEIILGSNHPTLQALENAVGPLSDVQHPQLLYGALQYSTVQFIDDIILEVLRTLSNDPSLRKLVTALAIETELMEAETVSYRPILAGRYTPLRVPSIRKRRGRRPTIKKRSGKREKTSPANQKLLKDWLFSHSSCPYPTEEDKCHLCHLTGLTLQQLNNWFINARRRILPQKKEK